MLRGYDYEGHSMPDFQRHRKEEIIDQSHAYSLSPMAGDSRN